MEHNTYQRGLEISRNFECRTSEDTLLLYQIIQDAVEMIQTDDTKRRDVAMGFIVSVYEPYIKKVAAKIFQKINKQIEFEDVLQETYATFITLVYRYKKEIASFSYYINYLLPPHMYVWSKKIVDSSITPMDTTTIAAMLPHPHFSSEQDSFAYFNSRILENEYKDFIMNRAQKKSRSGTVQQVCYKYFLGKETCSTIANELNISYHAVYEIINKIKKELQYFFNESKYTDFKITSTGIKFDNE